LSRRGEAAVTAIILIALSGGSMTIVHWVAPDLDGFKGTFADLPGIRLPAVRTVADAPLADNDEVIGVAVNGRFRAYAVNALNSPDRHVVNDLVDGRPVSVTYCPRSGCVSVYTGAPGNETLPIAMGGWMERYDDRTLLLLVGATRYRQDTGTAVESASAPLPFPRMEYQRVTWKQWREEHPDTEVYAGEVLRNMSAAPGADSHS
jgi:hypothetical protein